MTPAPRVPLLAMLLIGLLMGAVVIHLVMVVPIAERAADEIQRTDQLEDQLRRLEGESRRAQSDLERLEEEVDSWRRQAEENGERLQLLTRMGWRSEPMPARRIMVSARHHNVTLRPRPGENVEIPFLLSLSRMLWLQVSADELVPADAQDVPDIRARALSVEQLDNPDDGAGSGGEPSGDVHEGSRLSPGDGTLLSVDLPAGGYSGLLEGAPDMKIQTITLESIGEQTFPPGSEDREGGTAHGASAGGGEAGSGGADGEGSGTAGGEGSSAHGEGGGSPAGDLDSDGSGAGAEGLGDTHEPDAGADHGSFGDLVVYLRDDAGKWHKARLRGWGSWLNREIKLLLVEHNADN